MNVEMTEYKIGDVVLLKSGGPLMTVTQAPEVVNSSVQCAWFTTEGLYQCDRFLLLTIRKANRGDWPLDK